MAGNLTTVVVAVAPYHRAIATEAIQSIRAQTIETPFIVIDDPEERGAGWARNRGAEQVRTPFVTFLDADDLLAPTFVEQTARYYQPGKFVYTDWLDHNGQRVQCPDCTELPGWVQGRIFQPVTTLLPMSLYKAVEGFDESLPTAEDADFYQKIRHLGSCGVRCPYPLFTYRRDRGRRATRDEATYQQMRSLMLRRHGRKRNMACCGEGHIGTVVSGNYQEGDVQVVALWTGNRNLTGPFSGRRYHSGNHKVFWMDRQDAQANGINGLTWKIKVDPLTTAPDVDTVLAAVGLK
jgi:hypothetical protein